VTGHVWSRTGHGKVALLAQKRGRVARGHLLDFLQITLHKKLTEKSAT
jgi:hypothetical protein